MFSCCVCVVVVFLVCLRCGFSFLLLIEDQRSGIGISSPGLYDLLKTVVLFYKQIHDVDDSAVCSKTNVMLYITDFACL